MLLSAASRRHARKQAIAWVDYTALMMMGEVSGIFPFLRQRCRLQMKDG